MWRSTSKPSPMDSACPTIRLTMNTASKPMAKPPWLPIACREPRAGSAAGSIAARRSVVAASADVMPRRRVDAGLLVYRAVVLCTVAGAARDRADVDLRGQRAVHSAFVGDFHQPLALRRIEIAGERDGALDAVDHPLLGLAVRAILGVDLGVAQLDRHLIERQRLALGVETKRHRGAGPQAREEEVVGTRAAVETTHVARLVGEEPMRADRDLLLKAPLPGLAYDHVAGLRRRLGRALRRVEIAARPGVDDIGDVSGVAALAQQMIGAGERDEALR